MRPYKVVYKRNSALKSYTPKLVRRQSGDRSSPPKTRARANSASLFSLSPSDRPRREHTEEKLVVKFPFYARNSPSSVLHTSEEDVCVFDDDEHLSNGRDFTPDRLNTTSRSSIGRRSTTVRVIPSPDDITDKDLEMVANVVSEKVYNTFEGTSCHQCRQKTLDTKTVCRSSECFGVRGQFCGPCLRNRYGEDARVALKDPNWICPPCRDVCNCSFCRKKHGRSCTGILIHHAKERGFESVKEYLERACD